MAAISTLARHVMDLASLEYKTRLGIQSGLDEDRGEVPGAWGTSLSLSIAGRRIHSAIPRHRQHDMREQRGKHCYIEKTYELIKTIANTTYYAG